ncbi:MAG: acyltransferase [Microthrixaceae bacterium]
MRIDSVDGLRAIAVVLVAIYHFDDRLMPGGFIGVDVFFVVSGYLVTALLLAERDREGSIDLLAFYRRRARRLWAAAWLVLGVIACAGLFGTWNPDVQAGLPGDTLAAFAHIENYWVLHHGGYLRQFGGDSPVRHYWSLSLEEQFYFVWPVVTIVLLWLGRRLARRVRMQRRIALGVLAAMGAVSIWWALGASPADAYLDARSRAVALVIGAALAWIVAPAAPGSGILAPRSAAPGVRRAVAAWAVAGAVVLTVVCVVSSPEDDHLRRGGFALVAVAAAGIVLAAMWWGAGTPLAHPSMVWLGRRSYGVYLIHWPLIVALGPSRSWWLSVPVVVVGSLGGAALLYRWVEQPMIHRRAGRGSCGEPRPHWRSSRCRRSWSPVRRRR